MTATPDQLGKLLSHGERPAPVPVAYPEHHPACDALDGDNRACSCDGLLQTVRASLHPRPQGGVGRLLLRL